MLSKIGQFFIHAWVKVFRIIPEFRILRMTKIPQKVSLKMLNKGDYNSFSVQTFDHLNLKLWIFRKHSASFKIKVSKGQDFGNFELSPMIML